MRALFFLFAFGFLTISCKRDNLQGPLSVNEVNKIRFQETLIGENIGIQLLEVTEDSRCPSDLTCFWEGNAGIKLRFVESNDVHSFEIFVWDMPHLRMNNDTIFSGYRFEIVSLEPYPNTLNEIFPSDYVVGILVEKRNSLLPNQK